MISRKITPDKQQLDTIIGTRLQQTKIEKKTNDTLQPKTLRVVETSPYAQIGAQDPYVSNEIVKSWLSETKNPKYMDDDFFAKSKTFKHQKFDDKLFNADKPLPKTEIIIPIEKPVVNNSRIDVSSEFNNL